VPLEFPYWNCKLKFKLQLLHLAQITAIRSHNNKMMIINNRDRFKELFSLLILKCRFSENCPIVHCFFKGFHQ